ncbi:conserved hypothetical protein [Histoplasma mississippiense (nom. inval.)]|uniref:conserved hypothetical protein n=1 Tax=Ajellomyces capsulatus (strain NAm1 / WU24) TaxID=2059318 RepID=UPI000157D2AB|nr:conserved hypothetical protein [Histoplasma mississippiense (nom. inval.)]EDN04429.1 conserved hypothetical protein [Histoplasma mississippiense (nom. inval.)]
MTSPPESSPPPSSPKPPHPIICNALRISLSASEYKSLHEKFIKWLPPGVQDRILEPAAFREVVKSQNKYNEAALRASLRVLLATGAGMKLFIYISQKLASRKTQNAVLAGFALGAYPQSQLRLTLAIYMSTRSLEFLFNELDANGWFKNRPWWFGSWLLMPVSLAQLFHAFVFDREAEPKWFGDFILNFTPGHIPPRPGSYPSDRHWIDQYETVDSLAKISELKWPAFISPILHPSNPKTLPDSLQSISAVTSSAHPSISSLSCALLHSKSPSCLTASLHQYLLSIPLLARFLTKVYLILSLLKFKTFIHQPILAINGVCMKILSRTAILSTALGTAWGSVCLFNSFLPCSLLPTQRFYLSGALAGLPFAFAGNGNRSMFLYFFRIAVDSAWKVGTKRGVWRGGKGGDLFVFVASWALIGVLLEKNPGAVDGAGLRKIFAWLRGDGFVDLVETAGVKKKGKKAPAAAAAD